LIEKKSVVIYVDTREKNEEFIDYLQRFGAVVERKYFEVGDISIPGNEIGYGIEHKSIMDLGGSLASDRLWKQIKDLADNSRIEGQEYVPCLLLVGEEWRLWKQRNFTDFQIAGVLNALEMPPPIGFGITVIRAHNDRFAAIRLVNLAKKVQLEKEGSGEHPLRTAAKRGISERTEALYILEGFPAISAVRASRILAKYGTVETSLEAMRKGEIIEVEGIGEKIAEVVKQTFKYGNNDERADSK